MAHIPFQIAQDLMHSVVYSNTYLVKFHEGGDCHGGTVIRVENLLLLKGSELIVTPKKTTIYSFVIHKKAII